MSDDLLKRARRLDTCIFPTERSKCLCGELADHIEKLETALREIAKTATIEDESWHPSYHDISFTQKQAEGACEELRRRIQIARKALEGKDD